MHSVLLCGAGKIGESITAMLSQSGRYQLTICDINLERARALAAQWPNCQAGALTLSDRAATAALLQKHSAVISALPYHCNAPIAELAVEHSVHYFDLTEDVETTQFVRKIATGARSVLMPQCGLAPGFISIAAGSLAARFDSVYSIKMRVGALPIYPSNRLKYALTWSTEGLINEYGNICEAIVDGQKRQLLALEGYEHFSLDGDEYEAFNTSGGLGSLCESLSGKVRYLDYKSIRYPGHHDLISFLMQDLRFNQDRETLRQILERSIATTRQDKCLILVEVQGDIGKRMTVKTYASTVYNNVIGTEHFGAIQITTAAGICAPLDLLLTGKLGQRSGIVRCEEIPLPEFLSNEFGKYYRDEKAMAGLVD